MTTVSELDKAFNALFRGRVDDALRVGLAQLGTTPGHLGAALLVARALVEKTESMSVGDAAGRIVDASIRRGDLAGAMYAAWIAEKAGEDRSALVERIATVFARGSARVGDVSVAPPPLPAEVPVSIALSRATPDALVGLADKALFQFIGVPDPIAPDAKVPRLPLFGALDVPSLIALLESLTVREILEDGSIVTEGEEGHEAFVVARGLVRVSRTAGKQAIAALGPGAIFGEMALVSDAPRAATVAPLECTVLLVASREVLELVARREPAVGKELGAFCRGRMLVNLFRQSPMFRSLAAAERELVFAAFETRDIPPGVALVKRGAESPGIFVIASGAVAVNGIDADGEKIVITQLGAGDIVGEMSLVLRRPASADVVATHPTVALHLPRDRFHDIIRKHPQLLSELYELASQRDEETRSVLEGDSEAAEVVGDDVLV